MRTKRAAVRASQAGRALPCARRSNPAKTPRGGIGRVKPAGWARVAGGHAPAPPVGERGRRRELPCWTGTKRRPSAERYLCGLKEELIRPNPKRLLPSIRCPLMPMLIRRHPRVRLVAAGVVVAAMVLCVPAAAQADSGGATVRGLPESSSVEVSARVEHKAANPQRTALGSQRRPSTR